MFSATPDAPSPLAFGRSPLMMVSTATVAVLVVLLIGAGVVQAGDSSASTAPGPAPAGPDAEDGSGANRPDPDRATTTDPSATPDISDSTGPDPAPLGPTVDPSATEPLPDPPSGPDPFSAPGGSRIDPPMPPPPTSGTADASDPPPETRVAPDVRNLECETAGQQVLDAGLRPQFVGDTVGVVRDQFPEPGDRLPFGAMVNLRCEGIG